MNDLFEKITTDLKEMHPIARIITIMNLCIIGIVLLVFYAFFIYPNTPLGALKMKQIESREAYEQNLADFHNKYDDFNTEIDTYNFVEEMERLDSPFLLENPNENQNENEEN